MSDDTYITDDVFKIGVLAGIFGGIGLFGYSQFLKKKSYLIEWHASISQDDQADEITAKSLGTR